MLSTLSLLGLLSVTASAKLSSDDYQTLRHDIYSLIAHENCAAILVRLAWHDAGTYDKNTGKGGPNAAMHFEGKESNNPENAGLKKARDLLKDIVEQFSDDISVADIWALAGTVAIEYTGGPHIDFRFGRIDATSDEQSAPEGLLPDAAQGLSHLRDIFYRMGFNDKEIVALSGAHTLGSCHSDRSGFVGPWSEHDFIFDNSYYQDLIKYKWKLGTPKGAKHEQYGRENSETMMLPSDMSLINDDLITREQVLKYVEDQSLFFDDFAKAWKKLIELGYSDDQLYSVSLPKVDL